MVNTWLLLGDPHGLADLGETSIRPGISTRKDDARRDHGGFGFTADDALVVGDLVDVLSSRGDGVRKLHEVALFGDTAEDGLECNGVVGLAADVVRAVLGTLELARHPRVSVPTRDHRVERVGPEKRVSGITHTRRVVATFVACKSLTASATQRE
jgi:hypothetical protein